MICWHREIILKERTAPPWSATLLRKVNLKLFLTSKYLPFLRDPTANLFRLTRKIQVGKDFSGDLCQALAHSRVTYEICELPGTVSNLWLCNCLGSENHLVGVWFSILVLHPQVLVYTLGLREKGIFTVKFKCHLHLEALAGTRGHDFGSAILWTLLKTDLSILNSWIYNLCTINYLTPFPGTLLKWGPQVGREWSDLKVRVEAMCPALRVEKTTLW